MLAREIGAGEARLISMWAPLRGMPPAGRDAFRLFYFSGGGTGAISERSPLLRLSSPTLSQGSIDEASVRLTADLTSSEQRTLLAALTSDDFTGPARCTDSAWTALGAFRRAPEAAHPISVWARVLEALRARERSPYSAVNVPNTATWDRFGFSLDRIAQAAPECVRACAAAWNAVGYRTRDRRQGRVVSLEDFTKGTVEIEAWVRAWEGERSAMPPFRPSAPTVAPPVKVGPPTIGPSRPPPHVPPVAGPPRPPLPVQPVVAPHSAPPPVPPVTELAPVPGPNWQNPDRELVRLIEEQRTARLLSYVHVPKDIEEHANIEARLREGGYRDRQIVEVVQNGVDAARGAATAGRVKVLLHGETLYVANNGSPLSKSGVESLLHSHLSDKRDDAIGRFGLGFKSLLGISKQIAVISQSASMIFDERRSREEISVAVKRELPVRIPITRIAWPTVALDELALDPIAAELAVWAVTIVRARLTGTTARGRLEEAIKAFPAEFVLFAGDASLEFESDQGVDRRISAKAGEGRVALRVGGQESSWRVLSRTVQITDPEAVEDAGEIHGRDEYVVSWAVPVEGREKGRFWAWFPLHEPAPVPGVLNAPWKTNDDRSNVADGPFNGAMMGHMADLIVSSLASFSTAADPAAPLDYLPRRDVGDAAGRLADQIWTRAAGCAIVADCDGALRLAKDLQSHPEVPFAAAEAWAKLASSKLRSRYPHPSCLTRERARRVRELAPEPVGATTATTPNIGRWLEEVAIATPEASTGVLEILALLNQTKLSASERDALRRARIILTDKGVLAAATQVCTSAGAALPDGVLVAHPSLLASERSRKVLFDILGVREIAPEQWLSVLNAKFALMHQGTVSWQSRAPTAAEWEAFWTALRRAPPRVQADFITSRRSDQPIRVKCADSSWKEPAQVLLAGAIVPLQSAAQKPDSAWLVDPAFREENAALNATLGLQEMPNRHLAAGGLRAIEPWRALHREAMGRFQGQLPRDQRPQESYLDYLNPGSVPAPVILLAQGSLATRGRMTAALLERLERSHEPGTFGHSTRTGAYPQVREVHPLSWLLESFGMLDVSGRMLQVEELLPFLDERWMADLVGAARLEQLRRVERGFPEGMEPEPSEVTALWNDLFGLLPAAQFTAESRTAAYETAARFGHVPTTVVLGGATLPMSGVYVTTPAELGEALPPSSVPLLVLSAACRDAFVAAGARKLGDLAPPTWTVLEDPVPAHEFEPFLERLLLPEVKGSSRVQRVANLQRQFGAEAVAMETYQDGNLLLVNAAELDRKSLVDAFRSLCIAASLAKWLSVGAEEAVRRFQSGDVDSRRAKVRSGEDLGARLLLAVGGRSATLKGALPREVADLLTVQKATDRQIAEVFLNSHGPAALQVIGTTMEAQGLQPPSRWGTPAATAFAESIGFPSVFGGESVLRRDPYLDVDGPIRLNPLHDFQLEVQHEILNVLGSEGRRRALVNLPTGAGKTRVTVQTIVEGIRDGKVGVPVLWVAQSDELCEQAVQCFKEVWANFGPERQALRISRLWGGISRGMTPFAGPHVVVASVQTMVNRVESEMFRWLADAKLVVIDEAHHAITKSYTAVLKWLDRPDRSGPPVIGLTATAFRGFSEDETRRLAGRFDNRVVPVARDPSALLALLQQRGVLAEVEYRAIDSNTTFDFTDDEIRHIETFNEIPDSALERLGRNKNRNDQIFAAVLRKAPVTRILVFALSVRHARVLAAELTLRGRKAASIDAQTPHNARRHLIAGFRDGSLPILVNYGVLTTGFDAPMTDVILIARPTFSPNLYQQMIGRGLRGPENGGKLVCHLMTVEDNFNMFGKRLAFHHFRELFNRGKPTTSETP